MKQEDLEFVRIDNDKFEEVRCKKCPCADERKYCMILETHWWMPIKNSICKEIWFTNSETLCQILDIK